MKECVCIYVYLYRAEGIELFMRLGKLNLKYNLMLKNDCVLREPVSERYNILQMNRFQFKIHDDDEWHYGMVPDITYTRMLVSVPLPKHSLKFDHLTLLKFKEI